MKARWWRVVGLVAVALVVLLSFGAMALRRNVLAPRITSALARALNCDVTLLRLDVELVPRIRISGEGLSIRLKAHPELPLFIDVAHFSVNLGLLSMYRRHVDTIYVDGLHINVPPSDARAGLSTAAFNSSSAPGTPGRALFSVDHVVAHDAVLNFVGRNAQNRPLLFTVYDLDFVDPGLDRPMEFTAAVFNPIPEGRVELAGTFGPWNRENPITTPMLGTYGIKHADLATINGIGGIVTASGTFSGLLTEIHADGTSDTPDFSLDLGGRPMPVQTSFAVTIDGTNGTTRLDRVEAHMARSQVLITGAITNLPGDKGHELHAVANVAHGRIEDLLRLGIDAETPLMTGDVMLTATFYLPPGPGKARDRLHVDGTFGLGDVHFTSDGIRAQMGDLSRRGLGKGGEPVRPVSTRSTGRFALHQGTLALPRIAFEVPGAKVSLAGRYAFGPQTLDFIGTAELTASMSQAVGGVKSFFLKPFNGLFRKNGSAGAVIPIRISGTRSKPDVSVRFKDIFK